MRAATNATRRRRAHYLLGVLLPQPETDYVHHAIVCHDINCMLNTVDTV
jgi:hypothetical protein